MHTNTRAGLFLILAAAAAAACSSDETHGATSTGGGGAGGTEGTSTSTGTGGTGGTSTGTGGTGTGGTSTGTGGGTSAACPGTGSEITTLPACQSPDTDTIVVKRGCTPNVDGVLHDDEWTDGTCFNAGDLTVFAKYDDDALYLGSSTMPTCGCPMGFYFNPDGTSSASGDEYAVAVFDDPFNSDGDRGDFILQNGSFVSGTVPAGIVTKCPPNQPTPLRYEFKIPFSAIGVTPGTAHDFGFALVHASAHWPSSLQVDASTGTATDVSSWGHVGSTSWK